jgi:RNA polymerase sigma factor (sigma-70 family)
MYFKKFKTEYPLNLFKEVYGIADKETIPENINWDIETEHNLITTLNDLTDHEVRCIELYFKYNLPLNTVGENCGISGERVKQFIVKAVRKIRRKILHTKVAGYIKYDENGNKT